MSIPGTPKPYYLKDPLENAIDEFTKKETPSSADLNRVTTIASVQAGVDKYRAAAQHMTLDQLEDEKHDCCRLGCFLEAATGKPRPPKCHAHAIVSGGHSEAAKLRAVLAWHKLRIDDPDNGCWLPENTAATPHPYFPKAVPHSRIHRFNYYQWLRGTIKLETIPDQKKLRWALNFITKQLHDHTFPAYVMLPKGKGL
ncbi:MAG: hypothetical protein BMS9Abin31_1160 [Gammaproteobacteria bacterium]|nr:MAG: hypothetical protein BMS9Abin31_1160 [Gammaproteobacteria bacterium]